MRAQLPNRKTLLPERPILLAVAGILTLIAAACGSEGGSASITATATGEPISTTTAPAARSLDPSELTPSPRSGGPTAPAQPREDPVGSTGTDIFIHDGFQTGVERTLTLDDFEPIPAGEQARVTVRLRNLSEPSGGLDTRATINFGGPYGNMLVLPTADGVQLVHLHRDGALREQADEGRFT